MLERGLYYPPTNSSPKLNLGEKKPPGKPEHRKGCSRIQDWAKVREQKDLGASIKVFQTGVNFQCLDLLSFKTNSCFQYLAATNTFLSLGNSFALCLERQSGWLRFGHYKSTALFLSCQSWTSELWAGLWAEKDKACLSVSSLRPDGLAEINTFICCSSFARTAQD